MKLLLVEDSERLRDNLARGQRIETITDARPEVRSALDRAGRFTHLFDPRTGRSPARYHSVSVIAPTATEADALSNGAARIATAPSAKGQAERAAA